jgi:RNA polymerase sigma factor (sigma-70 family)
VVPFDTSHPAVQKLLSHPRLTREQTTALAVRARAGDIEARNELVRCNMRLVVWQAKRYAHLVPIEDLLHYGSLGLLRAAVEFDPGRGVRFGTYAIGWVRQAIRKALLRERLVRLPQAEATKAFRSGDLLHPSRAFESLDGPAFEGGRELAAAILPDPDAESGEGTALEAERRARLAAAMRRLRPIQQTVLTLRFGLDGEGERTLLAVGEQLGLSRERIRQIQNQALAALQFDPALAVLLKAA